MTRTLAPDPFRALPDPDAVRGPARASTCSSRTRAYATRDAPSSGGSVAQELEAAARAVKGAEAHPVRDHRLQRHPLGDACACTRTASRAARVDTVVLGPRAQVSVKDPDGRRPEDWRCGRRALPGRAAAARPRSAARPRERALARLGAKKAESAVLPMVLENRAAGRLVGALTSAACPAQSLQQKRSFLEGKLGQAVGSDAADPHRRPAPGEGLRLAPLRRRGHRRAQGMPLFEERRRCATTSSTPTTARSSRSRPPPAARRTSSSPWATKSQAELVARREGRHPGHRLPRRQLQRHHRRLLAGRAGLPHPQRQARRARVAR